MRFHVLVFTLNHKSAFSRSDDVTSPYSLLRDVTLLSVLIGNVVLVVSQEKLSFTIVPVALLWVLCFEFKTKNEFLRFLWRPLMSPRPKLHLGAGSFLLSDTLGTIISSQTFLRKKRRKISKSKLFIIILPQHSILAVWQGSENTSVSRNAKYLAQWSILGYVL